MTDAPVRYEQPADVAVLTMDDGKANALGYTMMDALAEQLDRAEQQAKAVVLAGRPGRFCAGFDLKVMLSGPDNARAIVSRGADLLLRLYAFPKPFVVACTGHAMAAGALLLLAADTRIGASGSFKIGLNEVAIGMPLPVLAQELARDRLDPRRLTAATLQATIYDPTQAADIGYLDRVVDPDDLIETATAEATALGKHSAAAYAATKGRLRGTTIAYIRKTLEADLASLTGPATS